MSWFDSIPASIPVGTSNLLLAGEALAIAQDLPTSGSWSEDVEGRVWADRPSPDWSASALFVMAGVQLDQMVQVIRTAPATQELFSTTDNTELPPDTMAGNQTILERFFIRDPHGCAILSETNTCDCPWLDPYANKGLAEPICEGRDESDEHGGACWQLIYSGHFPLSGGRDLDAIITRNWDLSKLGYALKLREALKGADLEVGHGFAVDGSITLTTGPQIPQIPVEAGVFGLRGSQSRELNDEPMAVFLAAREATELAAELMATAD